MRLTRNSLAFAVIALALSASCVACSKGSSSSGGAASADNAEPAVSASSSVREHPPEVAVGSAPVLLAPLNCGPLLGADADAIYVTEAGKNDVVVRIAKKDGALTRLDSAGAPVTSVASDPNYVYIAATSSIKRVKNGANAPEPFVAKANPEMIAVDGPELYWVEKTTGLWRTSTSAAAPKKVFSADAAFHLVISADTFYFDAAEIDEKSHDQRAFVWAIPRVLSDADAPKKLPIGASAGFFSMTVDLADRSVYVVGARRGANAVKKELFTVGPNGMSRRIFARVPAFVAAHGGTMYFSDCGAKGASRIEQFNSGKRSLVAKLPDDECAAAFAVDSDALYVPGVRGVSKITLNAK